ncbi:MAG: hypothetical protein Q7T05_01645 [Dehalococcoidia bacterium]|nr:hypothetical protein [Dehalococcoidia bacterium]
MLPLEGIAFWRWSDATLFFVVAVVPGAYCVSPPLASGAMSAQLRAQEKYTGRKENHRSRGIAC